MRSLNGMRRYRDMSQFWVTGRRRIPTPALPKLFRGVRANISLVFGALGSATVMRAPSELVPVRSALSVVEMPGVNGPPDEMRVTPDSSQLSAVMRSSRIWTRSPSLGNAQEYEMEATWLRSKLNGP